MYIATETVVSSVERLRQFHPFFGITFLVCKTHNLPVGKAVHFPINDEEKRFLQRFYKPDFASIHYFQPFRTSSREGGWLSPKYPFSGSQSTRTRGDLAAAFLHTKGTDLWGWDKGYVRVLRNKLKTDGSGRLPIFWLAVWLFREREWGPQTTPESLIENFLKECLITQQEQDEVFETSVPAGVGPVFTDQVYSDASLLRYLKPAPDARPEEGGTLRLLDLEGVGPAHRIQFTPGERLTVVTGDNGLGKTFLLECAWWSLTGAWVGQQAIPQPGPTTRPPTITFEITGRQRPPARMKIKFDWAAQGWPAPKGRPTIPGLIIYARVDGSFAVWDPVRHRPSQGPTPALLFKREEVFYGLEGRIEGLLRDWVTWQRNPDQSQFEVFKQVLRRLSPPDLGPLTPGEPVRLPLEPREIPTLRHHFGVVPITHGSAGVKRIVTLAYLLVWAWSEHRINSTLAHKSPQKNVVVLMDEAEAHLHPKWQRVVLPALLDVANILSKEVSAQVIVVTHSPLILASLESSFSDQTDKLYHLRLRSGEVTFREIKFIRYGRVDEWLTSEIFELGEPRSREGEFAIQRARQLLELPNPQPDAIREATTSLKKTLAEDDEFWPRWLYFSEQKGVVD